MKTTLTFIVCAILVITNLHAQDINYNNDSKKTKGAFLFFDRFGKEYNLSDLQINTFSDSNQKMMQATATVSCSAGYFNVYFENGCGMEGSTSIEISRRNVICQLLSDISAFINSPLSNLGNTTKVNIWVRDFANMGISNPASSPVLGLGSQIYSIPFLQNLSGIANNMLNQTILTGKDAYTNIATPLYTGASNYYHSTIAFNFTNPAFQFHTNLNVTTASNTYDLYSIALHEFTHCLGFGSLVTQNGQSSIGANYPYYNDYDLFLKTQTGVPLIVNSTPSCSKYNYSFNPALNPSIDLQPGFTNTSSCIPDSTACNTAIKYVGSITQPVYTSNCFAFGSSLSHFEDQCQVPATFTVSPSNNKYFAMSNASGTGSQYMKRYLKPEERLVLCDLGYKVSDHYGSITNLTDYTYSGGICPGSQIGGVNDGISSTGYYTYIGNLNTPIAITNILANDYNAVSFECLEIIDGTGTLSNTSGTSFSFTPTGTTGGSYLLRYIPVAANGNRGNITYVFAFAESGNCSGASSCDMINNGGFEMGQNCGAISSDSPPPVMNCWYNFNNLTPDYFVRNCTPPSGPYYIPYTEPITSTIINTWNTSGNNAWLGLSSNYGGYSDGVKQRLNSPILPGTFYTLSFWGRTLKNISDMTSDASHYVMFAGSANMPALFSSPTYSLQSVLNELNRTFVIGNHQWNYYTATITNTTSTAFNYLTVLCPAFINAPGTSVRYMILDDISIKPLASTPVFSIPSNICAGQTVNDLNSYVSIPGGIFSGTGVSFSSGNYSFNPGGPGVYNIVYTYTTSSGCINTSVFTKTVSTCTGIFNNPTSEISVSPNPTNDVFIITTPQNTTIINYTLLSIDGKIIQQKNNVTGKTIKVDLSNESQGIYFLKIESEATFKTFKIIKQ